MKRWTGILVAGLATVSAGCPKETEDPEPISWEPGVFQDWSVFVNRCEVPRTGSNPLDDEPWPDQPGSVLEENHFLRSISNLLYLWYDEIEDQDPAGFSHPVDYFAQLKTFGLTESGAPKDRFHFTQDTSEWLERTFQGTSAGYGVRWAILSQSPPRSVVVADVPGDTPASAAGLLRGAEVLAVDGVDLVNDSTDAGIDALNAGLFPSAPGESHSFEIRDPGETTTRLVTMTSAPLVLQPVREVSVVETETGKVGYFLFTTHIAASEQGLVEAFDWLEEQEVDDLVVDLRYNGGGFTDIASQLAFMIAGPEQTDGVAFELAQFNDQHPEINPVTGQEIVPTEFYSTTLGWGFYPEGIPLPSLDLPRVYVITTGSTCSASEAVINGLRGAGIEVIQVGTTTCGKPFAFYPLSNCGITYFTVQIRLVNDQGFGGYEVGFSPEGSLAGGVPVPGCLVGDDFSHALGDPSEAMLATALHHQEHGSCPTSPQARMLEAPRLEPRVLGPRVPLEEERWLLPPDGLGPGSRGILEP